MGDFTENIALLVIGVILGLLSDVIKTAFRREKRHLTYSIQKEAIIAVSPSLPTEVRNKLPAEQKLNVINFQVFGKNTGTQTVQDATCHFALSEGSELIHSEISTNPPVGVSYSPLEEQTFDMLLCKGINLEPTLTLSHFSIYYFI
jgi:hypothetical protein